ncbi:Arginyl-tRNA--protein transferase 1 [Cryptotermes secundus]|uniref:Arginyl-tRNA--protein transferase 1 n=1 Tax=Cryptotermes secundus TaxID=105785 RepID=A0A2J7PVS0_9NEOP|nr:arginyl-tRNA--protein transferase 1 isoform X3 [Cryptotermes secundus]PNF20433.1 Arginyl-tRNA--protein transferase 1 [Cryptotermes secundus]
MSSINYSIVEYYAEHGGYRCGYCKSSDSNYSYGMWARNMTVQDYQDLIDRGWRRSGRYCYKPTLNVMCCPTYTIRCAALDFKISKSQKKVIKRLNRFLSHGDTKAGDDSKSAGESFSTLEYSDFSGVMDIPDLHQKVLRAEKNFENTKIVSVDPSLSRRLENRHDGEETTWAREEDCCKMDSLTGDTVMVPAAPMEGAVAGEVRKTCRPGVGPDANRPPCKKAKLVRLERKRQKILNQGYNQEAADAMLKQRGPQQQEGKSLENLLNEQLPANPAHRLELVLLKVGTPEFMHSLVDSQELFAKYQMAIHNETPEECNSQLFYEFLVDSPLEPWHPLDGPPHGYGSFHQQYWMDGRLIAVGVIDILPRCVSSVYFYYDPELGQLSLGTYASLREISLTQSLHGHASALQYYYMGFYIHTCPKMRYKASYKPSFLLCPEAYTWHPVSECKTRLDRSKYCRFNDDPSAKDRDGEIVLNEVLVLSHHRAMLYCTYVTMDQTENDAEEVTQYAKLVGMKCARRMLLVRP